MKAPLTVAHLGRRNSHRKPRNTAHHDTKGEMTMTKMTYVAAIDLAIASMIEQDTPNTEAIEKLQALRRSIEKRNSAERKTTPKEKAKMDADAILAEQVKAVLANSAEPLTVTAIKDADEAFAEVKVQKLSAIVRKLMADGSVKRDEVKRKAVFSLA